MTRRLHHVEITNWKAARHVVFPMRPGVTQIVGPNESGKTSSLDAIAGALAGARHIDARPLTDGELRGGCKLDLGDIEVERALTEANQAKGGVLRVTAKDGTKWKQADLDALFGDYSCDPLALARLKPVELIRVLQQLAGAEWCAEMERITSALSTVEADRTATTRELKKYGTQAPPGDEPAVTPIAEVMQRIAEIDAHNAEQARRLSAQERATSAVDAADAAADALLRRVQDLEVALVVAREELATAEERAGRERAAREALPHPSPAMDARPLQAQIAESGRQTRAHEEWMRAQDRWRVWRGLIDQGSRFEREIAELREAREKHARTMELPVPGLAWSGGDVTFDGRPWEQESTSKRLRICTKLAIALHPGLPLVLIHQGEGLDEASFAQICEECETAGIDCLMEVVGRAHESGQSQVIEISEGRAEWSPFNPDETF